eukprot:12625693-Alexandrium_andersonii.AAC.1
MRLLGPSSACLTSPPVRRCSNCWLCTAPAWPPRCAVRGARGHPPRPRHPMPPAAPEHSPWPLGE